MLDNTPEDGVEWGKHGKSPEDGGSVSSSAAKERRVPQQTESFTTTTLEQVRDLLNFSDQSSAVYQMERTLVAWVLMLRLDHDDLCSAWKDYGSDLEDFAINVVLQENHEQDDDDADEMLLLYLRLVCQVTARLPRNLYRKTVGESTMKLWSKLGQPLVISPNHVNKVTGLSAVWVDVCSTTNVYFQVDPTAIPKWIPFLFRFYRDRLLLNVPLADVLPTQVTNTNEKASTPQDETHAMNRTLRHILNGASNLNSVDFHETMLHSLSHASSLSRVPDSMATDMFDFVIVNRLLSISHDSTTIRRMWEQCCLQWILSRTGTASSQSGDPSSGSVTVVKEVILQRPEFLPHFRKWLLSLVISPDMESVTTRAMAWQALATLTNRYGWGWMIMDKSIAGIGIDEPIGIWNAKSGTATSISKINVGPAKLFCTWMRLASGELRIQLHSLYRKDIDGEENPKPPSSQHADLDSCEACARILQSGIAYTICLTEEQPHVASSLNADALLHLRQSFEESLWTSIEYLTLICDKQPPPILFSVMLSLFGTLLMEIDIFDLIHPDHAMIAGEDGSGTDRMLSSPQVIMSCLSRLLVMAKDPVLLPGLVHILTSIQNDDQGEIDPIKLRLLEKYLQKSLLVYLEWFWQHCPKTFLGEETKISLEADNIMQWALSCTDLFAELFDASISVDALREKSM